VGVRIPHGPPKKHEILRLVLFLLPDGAISLVQFSAHLFPNLITPPIIDLRVNCKGSTGLCVSGFCGYCRHADIGIGQQNADEGVPEHMRMNFFNADGRVPTCWAMSPTCSLTASNSPDRLDMMPAVRSDLSQSPMALRTVSTPSPP